MKKVWLIVGKEWREVFKDKMILLTSILLPVLFIAMPVGTIYFMERAGAENPGSVGSGFNAPTGFEALMRRPEFAGMSPMTVMEILTMNQFLLYFLMIPLMIPMFVAVYSIVGEKQQRTLEPLLATPVTVWELLMGKTLAGAIPAVFMTWVSYAVATLLTSFVASPEVMAVMVSPMWSLAMGVLAPLLTITAVVVGVIISSRVNDVRLAEQLGGLLVLPLVALTIPVIMGKLFISLGMFAIGSAIVALLDVALLYVGVRLFQRETILTRWK